MVWMHGFLALLAFTFSSTATPIDKALSPRTEVFRAAPMCNPDSPSCCGGRPCRPDPPDPPVKPITRPPTISVSAWAPPSCIDNGDGSVSCHDVIPYYQIDGNGFSQGITTVGIYRSDGSPIWQGTQYSGGSITVNTQVPDCNSDAGGAGVTSAWARAKDGLSGLVSNSVQVLVGCQFID